ncbi:MAG: T9SS type A sorting domain-containing protein [Algicola sp.]|nr:T9SS type A sorting domain-containing protein [Algicola sp.]
MKKIHMLKNTILAVVFLNLFFVSYAQSEPQCGTVVSPEAQAYFEQLLPQIQQFEDEFAELALQRSSTAVSSVPIKAHIIRTDAGSGGLALNQFNAAMAIMNDFYANAFLEFFLCEGINYIDDSNLYDFETDEEAAMIATHNVDNVINIYFANTVTSSSSGSGLCGYAYFPGGQEVILMNNSCATNGSTLSHEMGHFFALSHTHGNSNSTLTEELVDGSNCETTGDFICDTPADPQLSFSNVTASCVYTGNAIDANNQFFDPDPLNIMSYSRKDCRTLFSPQQYARIYAVYQTSRSALACPSFNVAISADFIRECSNTLDVDFTDSSVGATSWQWDVDGDDIIDYTIQNPSHTYTENGLYDVRLTISDGNNSLTRVYENYIEVGVNDINTTQLTLDLITDDFPNEIEWNLKDSNGIVLYQSPVYVDGVDDFQNFSEDFTINTNECYVFEITDSFGDGICCNQGIGSYTLTTLEGDTVVTGGNYGSGEISYMSNAVLSVEDYFTSQSITAFPNPADASLTIKLSNSNTLPDSLSIYNMLGQLVMNTSVSQTSDLTIDVSHLNDGMYFIQLNKDNNSTTIQFMKN